MAKASTTHCYVVVLEHYHFPPHETDMVAATPLFVVPDTPESADYARIQAHRFASEHAKKYTVSDTVKAEVKEHRTSGGSEEYRVWCDSTHPHCDQFVWVVRRVEFRK